MSTFGRDPFSLMSRPSVAARLARQIAANGRGKSASNNIPKVPSPGASHARHSRSGILDAIPIASVPIFARAATRPNTESLRRSSAGISEGRDDPGDVAGHGRGPGCLPGDQAHGRVRKAARPARLDPCGQTGRRRPAGCAAGAMAEPARELILLSAANGRRSRKFSTPPIVEGPASGVLSTA